MQNTAFKKELNRESYNGSPAKYDLRSWRRENGGELLLKGLSSHRRKPTKGLHIMQSLFGAILAQEEAKAQKEALDARTDI